jgi:hypothetical protein
MTQRLVFRVIFPVGRPGRPIPDKVSQKVTRLLRPWMAEALASGQPLPLPFPAAAGFRASAQQVDTGLLVHLWRPFEDQADAGVRFATIGAAARAADLPALCRALSKVTGTVGRMPAGAPCCIVVPELERQAQFPEMAEWLEEFADGVARAWLELRDNGPANPPRAGSAGPIATAADYLAALASRPGGADARQAFKSVAKRGLKYFPTPIFPAQAGRQAGVKEGGGMDDRPAASAA